MKNHKWIKFSILYLGAIVLSVSQMKVSPTNLRDCLVSMFDLTPKELSVYVAVFAVAPVLLAIPGGNLVKKYGAKRMSLVIMAALFLGNLLGYFADSFYFMLFARIIEGISFSFIMTTGMILISNWFKEGGYGLAVGIFGTFSAFAYAAVIYLLPMIYDSYGLKSIWLCLALISLIIGLSFMAFFDDPRTKKTQDGKVQDTSLLEAVKNSNIILLAVAMCTVSFVLFTYLDLYPTIFEKVYQLSTAQSSFNSMFFGFIGIPVGFIIGILIDKTGKPLTIGFITFLVMAVACFLTNKFAPNLLIIQVIVLSTCISFASTTISTSVPKVVKHAGLLEDSFAFIYQFYYIGALIGLPIVSALVDKYSWSVGVLPLTVVSILGAVLLFPLFKKEIQNKPLNK